MNWIAGDKLSAAAQSDALRRFVHRYTREHVPDWARKPRPCGGSYPVQFDSDADWLTHSLFQVRNDGGLSDSASYCQSFPTWPDNPELIRCAS